MGQCLEQSGHTFPALDQSCITLDQSDNPFEAENFTIIYFLSSLLRNGWPFWSREEIAKFSASAFGPK
jgi:hypothetical protein